jgi:hypothetical protein
VRLAGVLAFQPIKFAFSKVNVFREFVVEVGRVVAVFHIVIGGLDFLQVKEKPPGVRRAGSR